MRLVSKKYFGGNFQTEVSIPTLTRTTGIGIAYLVARTEDGKSGVWIGRTSENKVETYFTKDGTLFEGTLVANIPANSALRLKIEREGKNFRTYYKTTAGFVLLGTFNDLSDKSVNFRLTAQNNTTARFDDFSLSCYYKTPETPANLRPSSGTIKAGYQSISWDKVDGASGYLLRIDEISASGNKIGACNVNKGPNDVCETIPSTTYSYDFGRSKKYKVWVHAYVHDETHASVPVTTVIDVENVAQPSGLRSTCNPDGKSVRLMWDSVDGANSYKLRVDDKNGKVAYYDNITKLEYVAPISPSQTYQWWAHSTRDGLDSTETVRQEFKCVPVATPTPTPRPSVKPTSTPSPSASARSTYSPSPSPSASLRPTTTPSPTPLPSVAPAQPTNPIARFFSWLASIFE
jgi:hypothetical protein